MVKTILVPVDDSKYSFKAAQFAIGLAKGLRAKILLIHVVEIYPYFAVPEYLMQEDDPGLKRIRKRVESIFKKIEGIAKKQKVPIQTDILLRSRSPAESIITYAKRKRVDLIVMGTKGSTGFKKILIGSVAQKVSEHAHCSVLIAR